LKKKILVAGAAAVVGVLALSSGAVAAQHYIITSSSQVKDGSIALRDLTPGARKSLKGQKGPKGETGARGPQGPGSSVAASPVPGPKGDKGDKGADGTLPAGFATSASATVGGDGIVTVTPITRTAAGLAFGPYANGGTAGGSVIYDGAKGLKLSDLTKLSFTAKYSTDDHNEIGVPYLRVFFKDGSDLIFSPNTQPTKVTSEDALHTWNVLSGSVRYNDDGGNNPDISYAAALAAHGSDEISLIKVSAGFSAGQNLRVLLTNLTVNNQAFTFAS
jgi:hypothetical protein